jgi:hypothetical protein
MEFDIFTVALLETRTNPAKLDAREAEALQDAHMDFLATPVKAATSSRRVPCSRRRAACSVGSLFTVFPPNRSPLCSRTTRSSAPGGSPSGSSRGRCPRARSVTSRPALLTRRPSSEAIGRLVSADGPALAPNPHPGFTGEENHHSFPQSSLTPPRRSPSPESPGSRTLFAPQAIARWWAVSESFT